MKVYAVMYVFPYEGESLEGIYATRELAEMHRRNDNGQTIIREMEVKESSSAHPPAAPDQCSATPHKVPAPVAGHER